MNDNASLEGVIATYGNSLRRYIAVRISDPLTVEEILSDTFRIYWMKAEHVPDLSLKWFYRVAHNLIGNEYRRVARLVALEQRVLEQWIDIDQLSSPQEYDSLYEALNILRPDQKLMLRDHYWHGLSIEEMAESMGCLPATLRVRLCRARQSVGQYLKRHEENAVSA